MAQLHRSEVAVSVVVVVVGSHQEKFSMSGDDQSEWQQLE
jgi:hypothetical protein